MRVFDTESGKYRERTQDEVVPRNHSVMFDTESNRARYDSSGYIYTDYGAMMIVTAFEKRKKDHEHTLRIIARARRSGCEWARKDWIERLKEWFDKHENNPANPVPPPDMPEPVRPGHPT